ncbi:pdx1 [Symbiodinium necroappetens]|uniref:pyridoxal 5'-phosphate synthase (glutamine hydrolyzing) n=1 Tax=Symbiodinium necroappetens TaxID=1628268 RepID=A0A812XFY9_9DINO|nr:pdx1 [Symbiodinium necroappetens]
MIRTKGEAGTGDVVEAVRHIRTLHKEMRMVQMMDEDELFTYAKEIGAPIDLVQHVKKTGKLPVVNFAAGGVATPADAALCMQLGVDGVFVGSGTLVACWTFCPCQRSLSCNAWKAETLELSALLSRSGA